MARLSRRVGIRTAQINLPRSDSAGPAIVKTAANLGQIAFQKQADKRTQEAQLAAASLNFERDGEGNLVSPSLPTGENGLLAPSIYDRTYTDMVSQRYVQQIKIDTAERLNLIATEHRFDPSGYREVAEAYVAKVTELAPDRLKADVNGTAQIRMVEHFNHIIREKAERDHTEAGQVHSQSIDVDYDDAAGYAVSSQTPEDDATVGAKILEIRAKIEEGKSFNFWNEAEAQERIDLIDKKIALSYLTGEITRLANDPLTHAEAIEQLNQFAMGVGEIKTVDELGIVVMRPVSEVYPNPEDREVIAAAGIGIIKDKEAARGNLEAEQFGKQNDSFHEWWLPHSIQRAGEGRMVDMDMLAGWFEKASAERNHSLMESIQRIMLSAWSSAAGDSGTRVQRRAAAAIANHARVMDQAQREFMGEHGLENLEGLSIEQRQNLSDALWRKAGDIDIPQSAEMAEDIGGLYLAMSGLQGIDLNIGGSSLPEIQHYIKSSAGRVGVIGWDISIPMNEMLSSENQDQIDRALDIGRMLYAERATSRNMEDSTALGHRNGRALTYIFENYAPGSAAQGMAGQAPGRTRRHYGRGR
jgi:hypothetical protein